MTDRTARRTRSTSESTVEVEVDLDGTGRSDIDTSVPFFDHMLTAFAKHSLTDLTVRATGDTHIDAHHTVEDISIVLGQAIREALGDKAGISRYGDALVPLDEASRRPSSTSPAARSSCTRVSRPVSSSTSSAGTSPDPWCATCSRPSRSTPLSPCTCA